MGGVHDRARLSGNRKAPNCKTCHGTHDILSRKDLESPTARKNIHNLCGSCHTDQNARYEQSVHAVAMTHDVLDAPTCIDCHGEHTQIKKVTDPASTVYPTNISKTCSHCHGEYRLAVRYGFPADRAASYQGSFHGIATKFGVTTVANCATCHGWHDIRPSSDPKSHVYIGNLQQTCGQLGCHPNATLRFARGTIHGPTDPTGNLLAKVITGIYIVLIGGTIGAMLFHNVLDFRYRRRTRANSKNHHSQGRTFERMSRSERVQHMLVFISFTVLAITGFMLYLPEGLIKLLGAHSDRFFWIRGELHRISALVLVGSSIYHLIWVIVNRLGRGYFRAMLPTWQDLKDPIRMIRFYLGKSDQKPKFGRFSYKEKAEYWALVWGTVVMTITGFILWGEELEPILAIQLARLIHRYEAILAVLAIIVWHFYLVHWRPGIFPMSRTWLDGKISEEEMREEHEMEYEALQKEEMR